MLVLEVHGGPCLKTEGKFNYEKIRRWRGMSSVDERVKKIICEQLDVDEKNVVPEASFVDDLGADSLDQVELIMAMEEEFEVSIPDEDAETIRTLQDAINYIKKAMEDK